MKKVKAAFAAAVAVVLAPEFRPVEVKLVRAVVVAVLGALGVKVGIDLGV